MSDIWVCNDCCSNNDDADDYCTVCGAERPGGARHRPKPPDPPTESISTAESGAAMSSGSGGRAASAESGGSRSTSGRSESTSGSGADSESFDSEKNKSFFVKIADWILHLGDGKKEKPRGGDISHLTYAERLALIERKKKRKETIDKCITLTAKVLCLASIVVFAVIALILFSIKIIDGSVGDIWTAFVAILRNIGENFKLLFAVNIKAIVTELFNSPLEGIGGLRMTEILFYSTIALNIAGFLFAGIYLWINFSGKYTDLEDRSKSTLRISLMSVIISLVFAFITCLLCSSDKIDIAMSKSAFLYAFIAITWLIVVLASGILVLLKVIFSGPYDKKFSGVITQLFKFAVPAIFISLLLMWLFT